MGYRRTKEQAKQRCNWKEFCVANQSLMSQAGLPRLYTEKMEMFDDFLMHGWIDHHDDPIGFTDVDMTAEQKSKFKKLIWKYFEAGFPDPGIAVLPLEEMGDLARAFPAAFAYLRGS